jgi:hypothetical protein
MDTTDILLLYFGACCLGAAFIGLLCERAPLMEEPEPLVKDAPPLAYGGIVQRAKPAVAPRPCVMPSALHVKLRRNPETGIAAPQRHVWRNKDTGTIITRPPVLELMIPAFAPDDAAVVTLITELWRYPSTVHEEDDGA